MKGALAVLSFCTLWACGRARDTAVNSTTDPNSRFNPPAQTLTQAPASINPQSVNLEANIERLKLDVERIIPVHYSADNRKVMDKELLIAVGKGN
jgi:hypothetical protein